MQVNKCEIIFLKENYRCNLEEKINKFKKIKYWCYILHDKDVIKPHYHIYLDFGELFIDSTFVSLALDLGKHSIIPVKRSLYEILNYLIQKNECQKYKYTYSINDLKANFDIKSELSKSLVGGKK